MPYMEIEKGEYWSTLFEGTLEALGSKFKISYK